MASGDTNTDTPRAYDEFIWPSDNARACDSELDETCTALEDALEDLDYAKQALFDFGQQPDDTIDRYRALHDACQGGSGSGEAEQPSEDASEVLGD